MTRDEIRLDIWAKIEEMGVSRVVTASGVGEATIRAAFAKPSGNPTLYTLMAVMKALGLKFVFEPAERVE